ncbi:MAG: BON domain-containing protein [Desulfohalobiaceae bacterium]|nr:BON domain-containing protein [Desulfohalobiaceae bacterium]
MFTKTLHVHRKIWFGLLMGSALLLACMLAVQPVQAQSLTDPDITMAVERELLHDPGVEAQRIDVETEQGLVTLSGMVNNILARDRAARVARTVKGVRQVVNDIEVQYSGLTDQTIRESVKTALYHDPATESYEVEVAVEDGRVVLSGRVESRQEKVLAATVAKGVQGVRELENRIETEQPAVRSDTEIQKEIEQALKWNALVDSGAVSVRVEDRTVFLKGRLESAAEKNQVLQQAWTRGAQEVNIQELQVVVGQETDAAEPGIQASDRTISSALEQKLDAHPRLKQSAVEVLVQDGVVTLFGETETLKAKMDASLLAGNTSGVWRVTNQIRVRPETMPSDAAIAENVKAALLRDPYVEKDQVSVTVDNGRVTLSGKVDTVFERGQAQDAAARISGVIALDNNLAVAGTPAYHFDPYVDEDWYFEDYTWETPPAASAKPDWELYEDIRQELWWSPFVDSQQVNVSVDSGVATLSGVVDTMDERAAARSNAFEGGAIAVENNLTVKHGPKPLQHMN